MGTEYPTEVRGIVLLSGEIGAVLTDGAAQSLGGRVAGGSIHDIEGSEEVKSRHSRRNTLRRSSFLNRFVFFLSVGVLVFFYAPSTVAHEEPDVSQEGEEREVPQEEIERYEGARKAARNQRVERTVEENETGTDPRSFGLQWSPYYRYTELDNGLIQQDLVAFGVVGVDLDDPLASGKGLLETTELLKDDGSVQVSFSVDVGDLDGLVERPQGGGGISQHG